jgi:autotransporter translocation and assembly factor TamB
VPQEELARLVGFLGLATQSGIALTTHAEGTLEDIAVKLKLGLTGPWPAREARGAITLDAKVHPSPLKAEAVLGVEKLDPAHILAGLPAAQANLQLKADADGNWPAMKANADLSLGRLQFQEFIVESGRIRAGLDNGKVDLQELVIKLPTGNIDLSGKAGVDPKKVPFDVRMKVALARLDEVPRAPTGLAGALDLEAHATGTIEKPHAELVLKGRGLKYPGVQVGSLDLKIDGGGPLDAPAADVSLRATGLVVPGRKAESVALEVHVKPGSAKGVHQARLNLDYRESAKAVVKLDLAAGFDQNKLAGELGHLDLQLAGYRLRTEGQTRIAVAKGPNGAALQVDHLRLGRERVAGHAAPSERDQLAVDGHFGPGAQARGKVKIAALDLPELVATATAFLPKLKLPKIAGRLDVDLDVDRRTDGHRTLAVDLTTRLRNVAVDQRKIEKLEVGVKLRPRQVALKVDTSPELGLTVAGTLPLDAESLTRGKVHLFEAPLDLEVNLPSFSFGQVRQLDPSLESVAKLPGAVRLKVKLAGAWPRPEVITEVDVDELEAAGLNRLGALVRSKVDAAGVKLDLQAQHEGRTVVDAQVGLKLDGSGLIRDLVLGKKVDFKALVPRTPFEVKLAVKGVTAGDLPPGIFAPGDDLGMLQARLNKKTAIPPLRLGQLDASLEATGTIDAPRAGLALRVRGVGMESTDLHLSNIDTLINVRVDGPHRRVTVDGNVDWQAQRLLDIAATVDGPDNLPIEKSLADRRAQLEASIKIADLDLQRFAPAVPALKRLVGRASVNLQVKGDVGRPWATANLQLLGLRPKAGVTPVIRKDKKGKPVFATMPHPELDVTGQLKVDSTHVKLELNGKQRSQAGPGTLLVKALVDGFDLDRDKGKMDGMKLSALVDATALDISIARALAQPLGETGGRLYSRIEVTGTPKAPVVNANLRLEDGTVALIPLQQTFKNLNLAADVTNSAFSLRRLTLQGGDGTLEVSGKVNMANLVPNTMGFDIELRRFPAAASADAAAVIDTKLRFDGQLAPNRFDGEVKFERALVRVPETKSKDLQSVEKLDKVTLQKEEHVRLWERPKKTRKVAKAAQAGKPAAAPFQTHIKVNIPRHFRIQTKELLAELKAHITAHVAEKVSVEGEAEVITGRLHTLGKDFKIETAKITFPGGDPANPFLDVAATHQVKEYLVRVRIRGSAKKPELTLESEPDVGDQKAVLGLLLTGSPALDNAGDAAAKAAASALSGYAANALKDAVAPGAPIDVLKVDVGSDGQLNSGRVEVGTYITDNIYVSYARRFNAKTENGENSNEATLEYRFKPRWTLETRYGDAGAGGVDLTWTYKH